jgi:hypothetical protein
MNRTIIQCMKRGLFILILLSVGLVGQGQIKPVNFENRIPVRFGSITDLTGCYRQMAPSFDSVFNVILSKGFVFTIQYYGGDAELRASPNPFYKFDEKMDSVKPISIVGDVELISYEPIDEIERIASRRGDFRSTWIELAGPRGSDMAAFVQYRFYIFKDTALIDSFMTVGISYGDGKEVSRRALMLKANTLAAWFAMSKLVLKIKDAFHLEISSKIADRFLLHKLDRLDVEYKLE